MTIAATDYVPVNSGAAGAAKFAGSDSRKYNYFTPKGRKATHYEDMTLDVQPDPKRYLLQDWIISFADGTPTYFEGWTQAKSVTGTPTARSMKNGSAPTISASQPSKE